MKEERTNTLYDCSIPFISAQKLVCKHYSSFSMCPKNSELLIVNHHEENTNSCYAVIRHYFIATWNTNCHWMRIKWHSYFGIHGPFRKESTISKLRIKRNCIFQGIKCSPVIWQICVKKCSNGNVFITNFGVISLYIGRYLYFTESAWTHKTILGSERFTRWLVGTWECGGMRAMF